MAPSPIFEISAWLSSLGLPQYEAAFAANAIDCSVLGQLDAEDLKELGVTQVGHRRKMLAAIAALSCREAVERPASPQRNVEIGERRQVTTLFADIAGYTKLSTELDAEDLHALRWRFLETVERLVGAHGGSVERQIGDCVMAVFGAPVAHDNDPERAVRSALAIREAMPELSSSLGRRLDVHIGIASGEVMTTAGAGGQGFTVTGETVNLAARLTSRATAGEVLVSNAVCRALAGRLDCGAVDEIEAKGYSGPLTAWRVSGLRPLSRVGERSFVGRQRELRQLDTALTDCLETGRGQMIAVRGEAGIGKTRVLEEFGRAATVRGFAVHSGLVLDFGAGTGRDAIGSLVRSLLGLAPEADTASREEKVRAAVADGLVDAGRQVFLNEWLDVPQPPELRARYDAMDGTTRLRGARETAAELAAATSRRQPLLLLIEDIHWADQSTLDNISAFAEIAGECRVLLVSTSRLEGDPLARGWRPAGASLTIELTPLRPDEAASLAAVFTGASAALAERCIERAAGNPLFLDQLLRLAEDQISEAVPATVQTLVQARMDRLDPVDKRALQAASVFGQRFRLAGLQFLLENPGYDAGALITQLLVRKHGDELLFAHALIRDAVYATLLRSRRRELHRRAAEWFAASDPTLRAEHLDKAEDPAAAAAYLLAARSQASHYRSATALALAESGLSRAHVPAERFALACYRGELLHDLGRTAEAGAAFEDALGLAQDDRERCRARIGRAGVKRITDDLDAALADLEQAEDWAQRHGLDEEGARAHFLHGNILFPRGDIDGCLREHSRSLELARAAGSAEYEAAALGGLGEAEYVRGRMLTAHERYRRCVDVARQNDCGRIEVANRPMAAITRAFAGDIDGGLEDSLAAIAAAAAVGHARAEMIARHGTFFCLRYRNQPAAAMEQVERALDLARQLNAPRFEAEGLAMKGEALRLLGHATDARASLDEALGIIRQGGMAYLGPMILGLVALAADDAGRRDSALAEGEEWLERKSVSHNHFFFRADAIDACLAAQAWDHVDHHATRLEAFASVEPTPFSVFFVARGKALAAFGRGRRDEDLRNQLTRLCEHAQRCGHVLAGDTLRAALYRLDRPGG